MTEKTIDRRDQTSTPTRDTGRYHTLDGMRGLAAIFVAIGHYGNHKHNYAPSGFLAVDFFFVLSGFVIALNYERRLRGGLTASSFMLTRLLRLYPLYLFGLALGAAVVLLMPSGPPAPQTGAGVAVAVLTGLVMLPSLSATALYPLNGPAWSVVLEILINIAYGAALARIKSLLLLAVAAAGATLMVLLAEGPYYINGGWRFDNMALGLARASYSFTVGILIFRTGIEKGSATWLAVAPVSILVVLLSLPNWATGEAVRELTIAIAVSPILMVAGAKLEAPMALRPVFGFLGDVSYPLYAFHWTLRRPAQALQHHLGLSDAIATPLYIGGMVLLAAAATRFYDVPVRRLLSRRLQVRRAAQPQVL